MKRIQILFIAAAAIFIALPAHAQKIYGQEGSADATMDDTEADHKAIQPVLSQIAYYPVSEFDGKMKTKDWSKLTALPGTAGQV